MKKIKEIKNKMLLTGIYVGIVLAFWALQIPCIFKQFLGIECMGCGMTRAVISAVTLDFGAAFSYHPMFWSLPILYLYFLFDGTVLGKKALDRMVLIGIGIGFLVNWIFKIV